MKAVLFEAVGQPLVVGATEKPRADPGCLVLKVGACGICGSDLHAVETPGFLQGGTILGHEYAGEVVEVGPGVGDAWKVGDRLIAIPARVCGTCPACLSGQIAACRQIILQGLDPRLPGAYAEYTTCMAAAAMKLPGDLDFRDAAVVEPLAVGLHAFRAAQPALGASVLIVGAGVIGLAVAKWARFFGAVDVVVSEKVPARIERARQAGATLVVDAGKCDDPVAEAQKITGRSPAVIFECVGRPILQQLIDGAPTGAHLVAVGTGMQPEPVTVLSAAMKHLRMSFAFGYDPAEFGLALQMLAAGRISAAPLVTAEVGLDEVPAMFEALKKPNDHGKVLITP